MSLDVGSAVRLRSSGARYRVEELLGRGGQGAVYRVAAGGTDTGFALKWYRPAAGSKRQHARLERVLGFRRPSTEFLWPIEFATRSSGPGWGYVMPLGDQGVVPLSRVVKGSVDMRLRAVVTAAARLAQAFKELHALGLCYADVSLNNVLVDAATGFVQICDNDNVTVNGEPSDVLGTPYFIAPEVVRGDANPSIASDRHSLAVMLFYLLVRQHPLLGEREQQRRVLDEQGVSTLLGAEPLFVFDPDDDSNRPVEGVHENLRVLWPALPTAVRRLFERAFTVGLDDPSHGRVTEAEWLDALLRLRGLVRVCLVCGTEQYLDESERRKRCAESTCGAVLEPPAVLAVRPRRPVVLDPGRVLLRSDLTGALEGRDEALGDVVRHPVTSGLAIRNRSGRPWRVLRESSTPELPSGAAVLVRDGLTLDIDGLRARASFAG